MCWIDSTCFALCLVVCFDTIVHICVGVEGVTIEGGCVGFGVLYCGNDVY